MFNDRTGKDDNHLMAVGEIEAHRIEIMRVTFQGKWGIAWFAYQNERIVAKSETAYETVDEALDAAILHFYPDAEKLEMPTPTAADFEALNAQLYAGGLNEDITDIQTVIQMHQMFSEHLPAIGAAAAKAHDDLGVCRQALIATHGAFSDKVIALSHIDELFTHQCLVLQIIAKRNIEILQNFIEMFMPQ